MEGCGCSSQKKRKLEEKTPPYKEMRAGRPEGDNPLYVVIDWALASVKLDPADPYYYSKFQVDLPRSIEGYNKCSLVNMYVNNVSAFSGNSLGYFGICIDEIPGSVRLATKNPLTIGKEYKVPTFLVPRAYPFNLAQPTPDTNAIAYSESTKGQFELDVATINLNRLTITLTDQYFNALKWLIGPVTNYEFRCLLRFYNDVRD